MLRGQEINYRSQAISDFLVTRGIPSEGSSHKKFGYKTLTWTWLLPPPPCGSHGSSMHVPQLSWAALLRGETNQAIRAWAWQTCQLNETSCCLAKINYLRHFIVVTNSHLINFLVYEHMWYQGIVFRTSATALIMASLTLQTAAFHNGNKPAS